MLPLGGEGNVGGGGGCRWGGPGAGGLASAWRPFKQNRPGLIVTVVAPCRLCYGLIHLRVLQSQQHSVLNLLLLISIPCTQIAVLDG